MKQAVDGCQPVLTLRGGSPLLHLVMLSALAVAGFAWISFQRAAPPHAQILLEACHQLQARPAVSTGPRHVSDRFVVGTPHTLLHNATIWTGLADGTEIIYGDVLLSGGLIQWVGRHFTEQTCQHLGINVSDLVVTNLQRAWITPGLVDLHSHAGVSSLPALRGFADTNSILGITQPWLRSIDALNTHDLAYNHSIAGGVTTSLILPGSADSIGGQGFVIKLRRTKEMSPFSMVVEPPFTYNGSGVTPTNPPRWRYLKQACGENPHGTFGATRMDSIWALRAIYEEARRIKVKQDEWCSKARRGLWKEIGDFPFELRLEALVDVLRGKVKVNTHCYTAVDLDGLVRLSNEFKFSIAAFHHAHETYLVPETLKKTYGGPPASAIFAAFARYKAEAYRHSEFAPRILHDNGLKVIMKSDHPFPLNNRALLFEAQQAHYYGLPANVALQSVTSTPADVLGLSHRVGYLKEGFDADIVVWDSHPLSLGATPTQVFIDGVAQIQSAVRVTKPPSFQKVPETPDFSKEAAEAVQFDGLPPLFAKSSPLTVFTNVRNVWSRSTDGMYAEDIHSEPDNPGTVVVENGVITCVGKGTRHCSQARNESADIVDLRGGSLAPGLISFGSPLGLQHIAAEGGTADGVAPDPLLGAVPHLLGGNGAIFRGLDGLQFGTRDALLAYRSGVTIGVTAPIAAEFTSGLSVAFSLGADHRLQQGALVRADNALCVVLQRGSDLSVSAKISALRRLLSRHGDGDLGHWFESVRQGEIPLVINVVNADIMAALLSLKTEIEQRSGSILRMVFTEANEAHILAKEIAEAGVGVIVNPRPSEMFWQGMRIPGRPPVSNETSISALLRNNVTVGIGSFLPWAWATRNTRFELAWAAIESDGRISKAEALALASSNLEKLLGLETQDSDFVAYQGGDVFDLESKVVGVISPRKGSVSLF